MKKKNPTLPNSTRLDSSLGMRRKSPWFVYQWLSRKAVCLRRFSGSDRSQFRGDTEIKYQSLNLIFSSKKYDFEKCYFRNFIWFLEIIFEFGFFF